MFFKKVVILYRKGEFAKIKGNISNIPVETDTVCKVLPRTVNNNGLVNNKLRRHLRHRGYAYFEPVRLSAIHEALNYLIIKIKFYEDISIFHGLISQEILNQPKISGTGETAENS